jgi:hypothetical protein
MVLYHKPSYLQTISSLLGNRQPRCEATVTKRSTHHYDLYLVWCNLQTVQNTARAPQRPDTSKPRPHCCDPHRRSGDVYTRFSGERMFDLNHVTTLCSFIVTRDLETPWPTRITLSMFMMNTNFKISTHSFLLKALIVRTERSIFTARL